MTTRRRRYTAEFRAEALRLVQRGDRSAAAVARELGIHPEVLRNWVRLTRPQAETTEEPAESMEVENRRLRRENARLLDEREILKKAAVYFANESR